VIKLVRKHTLIWAITCIILLAAIKTNIFPINIQQVSAQNPKVTVSRIYNFKSVNTNFLVYINVSDVVNLNGFIMNVSWNPKIIKLNEGDPGGITPLKNRTRKFNIYFGEFLNVTYKGVELINNEKGYIKCLWGSRKTGGVSGSGVLVKLNFTLIGIGTTKIEITNEVIGAQDQCVIHDSSGKPIPHDELDGIVSDQPPPTPQLWEEPAFQYTMTGVICVVGAVVIYKTVWKKVRFKRLLKMSREVQPIYEENEPNFKL
jgi:hypothetical protein